MHKSAIQAKTQWFQVRRRNTDIHRLGWVSSNIFQAYLHWLYMAEIDNRHLASNERTEGEAKITWLALVELYHLANYFRDYILCNKLADLMLDKSGEILDCKRVAFQKNINLEKEKGFLAALESALEEEDEEARGLLADIFFTLSQHRELRCAMMEELSNDAKSILLERWTDSKAGFKIPPNKEERERCKARYHKGSYKPPSLLI